MHMNFHLAFEKLGVPIENRETIFRYGFFLFIYIIFIALYL